jgi:hypothetical protein
MDDPVRRRLRPARPGGLTSPDPVTASLRPQTATRTRPRDRNPGQAAEQASGGKHTPKFTAKIKSTAADSAQPSFKPGRWIEAKGSGPTCTLTIG